MNDEQESSTPGWDAIDDALRRVYGDLEPKHWGTVVPYSLGGPDPLTGLSAFLDPVAGRYWHFITYGFSELDEKISDDPLVSGFGFEMTFRVAGGSEVDHSTWVFNFLQNLARHVFQTGRCFGAGHTLPLNGPIQSGYDTAIQAITFAEDAELGSIETPNGKVKFLQVVGITLDELAAIQSWNAAAFVELMSRRDPLLITDIDRVSNLTDESFAAEARSRSLVEGSSCGEIRSSEFSYSVSKRLFSRTCALRIGALLVDGLTARICGRIPYGRSLTLSNGEAAVEFAPGQANSWALRDEVLFVSLTDDAAKSLRDTLMPKHGRYVLPWLDRFEIEVTRTDIRNEEGDVVETIG